MWWSIIYGSSKTSCHWIATTSSFGQMITRATACNNKLLRLMKQKIYNKNNAVHYYEWMHCYCSSIFFRSILENRMLFWIDIIGYCSPQVLQVLQHYYKYHWQLVQVFLLIFRSIHPYIRIWSPALSSPTNTHPTLISFARFFLIRFRHIVISSHQQQFVVYSILHPRRLLEQCLTCSISIHQHTFGGTTVSFYFILHISFT